MNTQEIVKYIDGLFDKSHLDEYKNETGIIFDSGKTISRIGYCTNLTLQTIELAKENSVDLMITHHDAWDSIYGLREACIVKLKEYGISHYFNHSPLDDISFGTNDTFMKLLGISEYKRTHKVDGWEIGRVGELDEPIEFEELIEKVENLLEEPVMAWKFNDRKVKRIGLVCGGGGLNPDVRIAVENGCDVYITGEKILYTLEYAQLEKMNLIIGSHTFTEVFGVESLVGKILDANKGIEMIRLHEEHLEAISGNMHK